MCRLGVCCKTIKWKNRKKISLAHMLLLYLKKLYNSVKTGPMTCEGDSQLKGESYKLEWRVSLR